MLVRTVRMTFRPDRVDDFLALFRASAPRIRAFPGCHRLALLADARYPNVLTTYSLWEDEAALDRYRASALFKTTWAETKPLFAAPPVAHSQYTVIEVEPESETAG
jgi:quinol monooxygenase YgiN